MTIFDIRRAHFMTPMDREACIEQDKLPEDGDAVGLLQRSMYGFLTASANWMKDWQATLEEGGYKVVVANPAVYTRAHPHTNTNTPTHHHTHTNTHTPTPTHQHTNTPSHTHQHTNTPTHTHTHQHTNTHTHTSLTNTHTHQHTPTLTNTHQHTPTHTHQHTFQHTLQHPHTHLHIRTTPKARTRTHRPIHTNTHQHTCSRVCVSSSHAASKSEPLVLASCALGFDGRACWVWTRWMMRWNSGTIGSSGSGCEGRSLTLSCDTQLFWNDRLAQQGPGRRVVRSVLPLLK